MLWSFKRFTDRLSGVENKKAVNSAVLRVAYIACRVLLESLEDVPQLIFPHRLQEMLTQPRSFPATTTLSKTAFLGHILHVGTPNSSLKSVLN